MNDPPPTTRGWKFHHLLIALCAAVVAAFLAVNYFASRGNGSRVELGTVQGKVTKDGQPQANLCVEFTPIDGGRGSEGRTNEQGWYEAIYTVDKKGVLVGSQTARVSLPEELDQTGNVVTPRKPIGDFQVEVKAGTNRFDFQLEK